MPTPIRTSVPPTLSSVAPRWAISLFVTLLALWMGAAVFFSVGVLPVLFTQLEPSQAGEVAALLFPVYFKAGLAIGVACCLVSLILARGGGNRWLSATLLLFLMTAAQAWTTLLIHPEMATIRGVDAQAGRFQQLHVLSVRLNGVVLVGGLLLLGGSGLLLSRRGDPT